MRQFRGFTLIELMIVVAIVAILAAVGYPSYREHIARGQRSQGQQYLSEISTRQEQFLLDRRGYGTAAQLNVPVPTDLKYVTPPGTWTVNNGATPPTYVICMVPVAGSNLAARGDGNLCVNNNGQRWRETDGNTTFASDDATNCTWENRSCAF